MFLHRTQTALYETRIPDQSEQTSVARLRCRFTSILLFDAESGDALENGKEIVGVSEGRDQGNALSNYKVTGRTSILGAEKVFENHDARTGHTRSEIVGLACLKFSPIIFMVVPGVVSKKHVQHGFGNRNVYSEHRYNMASSFLSVW